MQERKAWHLLNNKKPTKRFLMLTKSLNEDASLTHIKKLCANVEYCNYNNNQELNKDLVDFYKNIYCKITNKTLNLNNFLPDYVINQPEYKNASSTSKNFNIPISLCELTEALKQTKNNTSPEIDGFTYTSLKFLWPLHSGPIYIQRF